MHTFNARCSLGADFHKGGHELGMVANQRRTVGLGGGAMVKEGKIRSLDLILSAVGIHWKI